MPKTLDLPPVWLVAFMGAAWMLTALWSIGDAMLWPGRLLIAAGIGLMIWSAIAFRAARTTIVPHEEPTALVETGPYRYSRNPIYVADLMILGGWCLSLGAPHALLLIEPFRQVLLARFVLPEEALLTERLGRPYTAFCNRVRRWV